MASDKRVIIFDDDEELLEIFRFLFEDEGWQVNTFTTCDDVVENTRRIMPDLILMDNWIPSTGGIAATQSIKADLELTTIPIIYVSANNDVEVLSQKAGADGFLAKPFEFDKLLAIAGKLTDK
ncbi:response regulator [Pedobacter kyonggii]|uniref:Response regulator n=1 Tax=Pedobacter kyonggii TaxID=1926871 RepID=A0A4Q9H645_9SPHI|nr:response regulator [Pedobacter kyonggii]TBO35926.1 response regulator [Pedobacter kyonggii]